MSTQPQRHTMLTIDEYFAIEESSSIRHEYIAGEMYAHAGASRQHNVIIGNLLHRLWDRSQERNCTVVTQEFKLRIAEDAVYYPDLMVLCDPDDSHQLYATNPCLVVEVLSPSTESIDRREKLMAYRRIPGLRTYLIVYQDAPRVIRHWRDDDGTWWQADVAGAGNVPISCLEQTLTLADIYVGVTFERPS